MVPVDTTVKKGSLAVHAAALSIENIAKFDVHDFIHMDDITVTQTAEGGTITDGTGTIQLVNKLGATLVFGAAKLQGFIGLDANGNKVIYPSLMTGPTGINQQCRANQRQRENLQRRHRCQRRVENNRRLQYCRSSRFAQQSDCQLPTRRIFNKSR
jgi:hypothetical protein